MVLNIWQYVSMFMSKFGWPHYRAWVGEPPEGLGQGMINKLGKVRYV